MADAIAAVIYRRHRVVLKNVRWHAHVGVLRR